MSVIPLRPGDKRPASSFSWKEFQDRRPEDEELEQWFGAGRRNIAVVTGAISGIVVIDIDGPAGEVSLAEFAVPETVEVKTPNGRHLYFKHPGRPVRNGVRLMPGIDVRADGGYVVAPPSRIGEDGYEFVHAFKDTALANLPGWFWDMVPQEPSVSSNGEVADAGSFIEGMRNDRLASEAGSLRRRGWSVEDIADSLLGFNERHCVPPLPEREVRAIAKSMGRYEPEAAFVETPTSWFEDWDDFQKEIDYHNEQSTWMNTVDMRPVEWLWPDFIPRGMVTILTGEEGLGKSQLALRIAADFSAGRTQAPWSKFNPKDDAPGGLVKIYSAEDPLHQVLVPRMQANGANMSHIATEGINVQTFLPDGIKDIARGIHELAFGMVIIDPVISYIGAQSDSNSAQDVRAIMRMLADLAEQSDTVIIGVMHPKKGEESQLLHKMIGGSSAFGQAARSVLGVARHPEEKNWRVVGRLKGNLSRKPTPMAFEIKSHVVESNDARIPTSRVEYRPDEIGEDFDFDAALQGRKKKGPSKMEDRTLVNKAIEFLGLELKMGPVRIATIRSRTMEATGCSRPTVYRAREEMGLVQVKLEDGNLGWSLPG